MGYIRCGTGEAGGGETPILLWENSSPTSAFSAQTIALDLTGYEALLIETWYGNNQISDYYGKQINYVDLVLFANDGGNRYSLGSASKDSSWHASRMMRLTSTGLSFTNCGRFNGSWNESHNETITTIPVKIYGLKKRILNV